MGDGLNIKLDDIELVKRVDEEGVREVRSILNVTISGKRHVKEFKVPGLEGNVFQDLGRDSLTIIVEGLLTGLNSKNTFQEMNSKFKLGRPVPFITDIPSLTEISEVVVEGFKAKVVSGVSLNYWYLLTLKEHKSSPPQQSEASSQEETAREETKEAVKQIRKEVESKFEEKEPLKG
jgi:hypothetical protein